MSQLGAGKHREDFELITNYDLISSAHALMGGIDLDVASSKFANTYVEATNFYTPSDDGLNAQDWHGSVYLFPPGGTYFWDKQNEKWKMTRASSPTLTSSHAVWFRRLYKAWWKKEIKQAVFFSNCPDMVRYEQKIFDFPICFLRTAPILIRHSSAETKEHKTCTSLVVYLPEQGEQIQDFINIYSEKGRVIC